MLLQSCQYLPESPLNMFQIKKIQNLSEQTTLTQKWGWNQALLRRIPYWMEQPCKYLWIDIFASCLSIPKRHKKHDEARPWFFTWPQNRLYNKTLQEFRTFHSSKTVIAMMAFMIILNFMPFLLFYMTVMSWPFPSSSLNLNVNLNLTEVCATANVTKWLKDPTQKLQRLPVTPELGNCSDFGDFLATKFHILMSY